VPADVVMSRTDPSDPDGGEAVDRREPVFAGALSAGRAYWWLTAFWLTLIGASGVALWITLFGVTIPIQPAGTALSLERDDADAVVITFGRADDDRVTGIVAADPLAGTRVMTYTKRRVRVTFVRRLRGSPPRPIWKLVGFAETDGKVTVSGEEALRRLKGQAH
jgi:hypothetical protein